MSFVLRLYAEVGFSCSISDLVSWSGEGSVTTHSTPWPTRMYGSVEHGQMSYYSRRTKFELILILRFAVDSSIVAVFTCRLEILRDRPALPYSPKGHLFPRFG